MFLVGVYCNMLKPFLLPNQLEAGCDEAGRGCLAGPVFAAAVILPNAFEHPLLNDSKKLSENLRYQLRTVIEEEAIAYHVSMVSPKQIDKINILKASILAMHQAVEKLDPTPEYLLIDGNRFYPFRNIPYTCIVKGDGKMASIAAASILAKTYRDDWMQKLHEAFPQYGWNKNKGYPTLAHREAIRTHGLCVHHRKTFTCLPEQGKLI